MLQSARRLPARLVLVTVWGCLVTLGGACVAGPPPTRQPETVSQDAPRTPELSTTQVQPDFQSSPISTPVAADNDCPSLDSTLAQIVASPDPLEQARQSLLTVKDGKIQVVLVLSQQDTDFLQSYDVEIGTQTGTQVQAFVPPGRLCDLAKTAEVLTIRPAAQAIPQ